MIKSWESVKINLFFLVWLFQVKLAVISRHHATATESKMIMWQVLIQAKWCHWLGFWIKNLKMMFEKSKQFERDPVLGKLFSLKPGKKCTAKGKQRRHRNGSFIFLTALNILCLLAKQPNKQHARTKSNNNKNQMQRMQMQATLYKHGRNLACPTKNALTATSWPTIKLANKTYAFSDLTLWCLI